MNTLEATRPIEELHPSLWKASQLARSTTRCIDTGHPALSRQLAGGGWPTGTLIELMVQQPGIGEVRLLAPALSKVADRQIVMIEPPHAPQILGLAQLGLQPSKVLLVKSKVTADALWAAEQVLKSASYGAVLFWAAHVRPESLRRLNLAAQAGETMFFVLRPLAAAQDASPSPLRLSLRPARGGVEIGFVKRRGPQRDEPLFLPLGVSDAVTPRRNVPVESPATPMPAPMRTKEQENAGIF